MAKARFKVGDHVLYLNKNHHIPEQREFKIIGTSRYGSDWWVAEPVGHQSSNYPYEITRVERSGSFTYIPESVTHDGFTFAMCVEIPKKSRNLSSAYMGLSLMVSSLKLILRTSLSSLLPNSRTTSNLVLIFKNPNKVAMSSFL